MEQTLKEMMDERAAFETAAALLIGRLVFEWSRLDLAIGLAAAWVDEGRNLEQLSEELHESSPSERIKSLKKEVRKKFELGSIAHDLYSAWIKDTDAIREQRNDIIHSRYGISGVPPRLSGARGLPNGPQEVFEYDLTDLQGYIDEMVRLQAELSQLRKKYPL